MLAQAGVTKELLQKAVKAVEDALVAETADGNPSHLIRLQAAREVLQIAGAYPSRTSSDAAREPVEVHISVAPFARGNVSA